MGSFERFLAIVIEQFAGRFPLWLSPVQVTVATITNDADGYARKVQAEMAAAGLRVETDLRNEKIKVALRRLGGQQQKILALDDAIAMLKQEALPPA